MAQRVVIVDDDPFVRRALIRELKGQFEVFEADGYQSAIVVLAQTDGVCAVVSDCNLGGGRRGPDILREVQQRSPSCVRLIVSATLLEAEAGLLLKTGVVDRFISKPWNPGEVRSAVQQLLASPRKPQATLQQASSEEDERADAVSDPLIGTMAGSFRLTRELGRGGMGTVYLGEHPVIGSKVAIKFLNDALVSNAELVARFFDEARAVNLIGHDNIVSIYDLSLLPPNRYFIVMEHLDGTTLASLLKQHPVAPSAALQILIQLCDALDVAHSHGVVHRDLKPDNVFLLDRRGSANFVKLVDFGIAKLRDARARGSMTAVGMILGTPEYMSPEQCEGREVDGRSDIYSLGVIAYQLATGRLPFTNTGLAAMLLAHLQRPPTPPRQLNPQVHPLWDMAILKALAKRPEDRFQTMGQFAEALAAALEMVLGLSAPVPPQPRPALVGPTPQPAYSRRLAGFEVEVRFSDEQHGQRWRTMDVSRGGVYLCTEGRLPPIFTRLRILFDRPQPQDPLEVVGQVVRHVTASEARAWSMAPGFGVEFIEVGAALRLELGRLVEGLPRLAAVPAVAAPGDDPIVAPVLLHFHKRVAGSLYEFLGVPVDASFDDVRRRGRRVREDLEVLRVETLSPSQQMQMQAILSRVEAAVGALTNAITRLEYDAQRGNYLGVTHCLMAGVEDSQVEQVRRRFLANRPGVPAQVAAQLLRVAAAIEAEDEPEALAAYEAALSVDPLNLSLHQPYWALKRELSSEPRA